MLAKWVFGRNRARNNRCDGHHKMLLRRILSGARVAVPMSAFPFLNFADARRVIPPPLLTILLSRVNSPHRFLDAIGRVVRMSMYVKLDARATGRSRTI
jgi:hypothetical protein